MEYSYKFRIYPTQEQENLIQRTFGCVRYVYNHFLAERKKSYEETGKSPTRFQQDKELTALKKELWWLKEPDKCALQDAIKQLDQAYQNFFRRVKAGEKPGYPKFKKKHTHRKSYHTNGGIKVFEKAIQLPKLGKVKCRVSKEVQGRILSATVSQNPSGKYFVSLCCTDVEIEPLPKTDTVIGLDMGIKSYAVTSEGVEYPNHKYLANSEKKLAKAQRQLSRKSKGSKNWDKARIKVARLHEQIANLRLDTQHKLSTKLIRENGVPAIHTDKYSKEEIQNERIVQHTHELVRSQR